MACVPMFNKKRQYRFEAVVRLHSLISVPYVNAVTFAKLRILNSRHSSQYSPRVELRQHSVTWNTEHRFMCRFNSNGATPILEPKILKISVRMETNGGKSYCKVGFVTVNLACFTALGNVVSRRRYILEGYDEKHKRLDNSLLLVSFSMRQVFGDTCFRPPPENLSNCLIEPPDSDEADFLALDVQDHPDAASTRCEPPIGEPNLPSPHMTKRSSSIDRILADTYSIQPARTCAVQAPPLTGLSTQAACDRLQLMLRGQRNPTTLSPEQLTRLLDQIIVPDRSQTEPSMSQAEEPSAPPRFIQPTELSIIQLPVVSEAAHPTTGVAPTFSRRSSNDSSVPPHPDPGSDVLSLGSHPANQGVDDAQFLGNVPDESLPPIPGSCSHSSSSSSTATATEPSLPTPTPHDAFHSHQPSSSGSKLAVAEPTLPVRPERGDAVVTASQSFDMFANIQCHSLPHHASLLQPYGARQHPRHPQHFATDSGLLLPSRRRKARPAADALLFPAPVSTLAQATSTTVPDALATTTATGSCCPSAGGESHSSSGYQSHSRQSSLESQTVIGTLLSPIPSSIASDCSGHVSQPGTTFLPTPPGSTLSSRPC